MVLVKEFSNFENAHTIIYLHWQNISTTAERPSDVQVILKNRIL